MASAEGLPRVAAKPLVLVSGCHRQVATEPYAVVGMDYIEAVRLAGCTPLVVADAAPDELDALLGLADGLLITGSPSNVAPSRYGQAVHDPSLPLDPARDGWVLPLLPRALERGVPLLAVCRGLQELNVALGGSLHQAVHRMPGFADHREPNHVPRDIEYGPAHDVMVTPGGTLDRLGLPPNLRVNSLHGQGIDRLAAGLRSEAHAPDGLVEAASVIDAPGFNLAVQWHPEFRAASNPDSMRIFSAFGAACAAHRDRKHRRAQGPLERH